MTFSKTSKIFVGKQYSATLKPTSKKAKSTKILNAKLYFKDKYNGQKLAKMDNADFDDGRWEMPDVDYSNRY